MPQMRVSQQNSTLRFRDHPADLQAVAEFLEVAYVLEGSLARAGENVVVVSRLLRIDGGEELAVLELERAEGDLAGLETEIGLAVADALSRQVDN
jgi:TolB-like protein